MSDFITTAFVQEYKATTDLLLQQKDERFPARVTQDGYVGKAASAVEQFGETAAIERTTRYDETPNIDVEQAKRWVFPKDYIWARQVTNPDKLRMLIDPTSPLTQTGVAAMKRSKDDVIIDAFFATAKVGENGSTDEAFDTTNYQVAVDTGGTASSLNVAKLQEARRMLIEAYKGEIGETVYCAISSYEHDALLKEIEVTSRDFNGGNPVLVDGQVRRFMGMEFVLTERLNISAGNRLIPIWTATGMHLGTWDGLEARIDQRPDRNYNWQVWLGHTIGATRLQQGKVIQVLCDDQI